MLKKIAHTLTRKPKLIVVIAIILLIPSILGMAATKINYDILSYLPSDLDSSQGQQLLEDPFHNAATTMLIVEHMPPRYTNLLKQSIEDVPGVSSATWLSSSVGIQVPNDMLPTDMRDMFFSDDSTMMIVQYEMPGACEETMQAIDDVRALCNKNCYLAGFSVLIKDTKDLMDKELPLYVFLAVILSLVAMFLTIDSWTLPFAFLTSIGLAIAYNLGSNVFLGQISYVTKAIAAVLQLGVTMDYSIFLYHRYSEERANYDDHRDAMAKAIESAFLSLSGSSLTTIAGFVALCFMRLLLGRDIGIVMAKGVVLGVTTVLFVLPAILLVFDKSIKSTYHRTIIPPCNRLNNFMLRHRKDFFVLFLILFVPFIYAQNHAGVYYKLDRALPQDMDSIVATNKLKTDYNMATSHFVIIDDSISPHLIRQLTDEINALDGIESVVSYDSFVSPSIPDFFVPDDIKKIYKSDGMQMIMINSNYQTASDDVSNQLAKMTEIVKRYDPNAYITGEAALTKDLIDISGVDFKVTSYISILAIFLIVALLFQSITVPMVLVSVIELAIFINQGIPYFTGSVTPFISPTIIGCVQMGATVDYAILMTTRFREELRNGLDKKDAMRIAATASDPSIITSALVLFCATLGVGLISKIEIIKSICMMLARGAIISALICIFILPSVLLICEPLIAHTSRNWRKTKSQNTEKTETPTKIPVGKL